MVDSYILALVDYAAEKGLIEKEDRIFAVYRVLEVMQLNSIETDAQPAKTAGLEEILSVLIADAVERGVCDDNLTAYDLFDTKLMGVFTPFPSTVRNQFAQLYAQDSR